MPLVRPLAACPCPPVAIVHRFRTGAVPVISVGSPGHIACIG